MVSGIGPKEILDGMNIPVLSDRSGVGQNLWVCESCRGDGAFDTERLIECQDHIAFSPAYAVDLTTHSQLASPAFAATQTAD